MTTQKMGYNIESLLDEIKVLKNYIEELKTSRAIAMDALADLEDRAKLAYRETDRSA